MLSYPVEQRFKATDVEVTRTYQEEVLRIGEAWKAKGQREGREWKVGVIDLWKALVDKAGGEGDILIPYFT